MATDQDLKSHESPKSFTTVERMLPFNEPALPGYDDEETMTWRQALSRYRPAVYWSLAVSMQNVMEGYNISLITTLLVFPAFAEKYGSYYPGLGWQVSYQWQIATGLGAAIGGIFGIFVGGWLIEKHGLRWTIMASQVLIVGTTFVTFTAVNVEMLFAGMVLNGLPWGVLASVGSIYASEVCPTALRGYIINFNNVAWLIGQLIASIVLRPMVDVPGEWSYRIPFAIQWLWPIPLFLIAYFAPDSPWRLMRKGDDDGAIRALKRLTSGLNDEQLAARLATLKRTNKLEQGMHTNSSYKDCFQRTNIPRTEVACLALASQGVTGLTLAGTPTYFMLQAGLSADDALTVNIACNVVGLLGNLICWPLMYHYGRRPLFIFGLGTISTTLLVIGVLDSSSSPAARWVQSAFCIIWTGFYGALIAPESYTIAGEISATRLRAQTVSLAKTFYAVTAIASATVQSSLVNPTGANIHGKSAYVWFGCSFLLMTWAFFRLPETKDRTYAELDVLFSSHVKARGFESKVVEVESQASGTANAVIASL